MVRFDSLAEVHGVHVLDTIGDAYLAVTNLNGDQVQWPISMAIRSERVEREGGREGGTTWVFDPKKGIAEEEEKIRCASSSEKRVEREGEYRRWSGFNMFGRRVLRRRARKRLDFEAQYIT
jgi:class 3 adenylate cyclase